jgi:hypothetical protein
MWLYVRVPCYRYLSLHHPFPPTHRSRLFRNYVVCKYSLHFWASHLWTMTFPTENVSHLTHIRHFLHLPLMHVHVHASRNMHPVPSSTGALAHCLSSPDRYPFPHWYGQDCTMSNWFLCLHPIFCVLIHHSDDGVCIHLWNVSLLQWDYVTLYPRRLSSSPVPCISQPVFNMFVVYSKLLRLLQPWVQSIDL